MEKVSRHQETRMSLLSEDLRQLRSNGWRRINTDWWWTTGEDWQAASCIHQDTGGLRQDARMETTEEAW